MRNTLALLAGSLLLSGCLAWADTQPLTGAQLDGVVAGQGLLDWFIPAAPVETQDATGSLMAVGNTGAATGDNGTANANSGQVATSTGNGIAANGDGNTLASENSLAISGDHATINGAGNQAVAHDGAAANQGNNNIAGALQNLGDNNAAAIGHDNVALTNTSISGNGVTNNGNNNTTTSAGGNDHSAINFGSGSATVDNSTVDGGTWTNGQGVVAQTATVTDSFNTTSIEATVNASITDAFNQTTNTLTVSGQANATALVLANTLGEQGIVVNMVVTNAESSAPSGSVNAGQIPASTAGANVTQLGIIGSYVGFDVLGASH